MSGVSLETDVEIFTENFEAAKGYHNRAIQFLRENQRTSLVFNVASVAIERYLIALAAYHGIMPFNHNYSSLMDAAEQAVVFDEELSAEIRSLDRIFGICSIDDYNHGVPETSDTDRALSMCDRISEIFNAQCITPLITKPTKED